MSFFLGTKVGAVMGSAKGAYHLTKNYKPCKNDYITNTTLLGLGFGTDAISTYVSTKVINHQMTESIVTTAITHPFVPIWAGVCVGMSLGYCGVYFLAKTFEVPNPQENKIEPSNTISKVDDNTLKKE